MAAGLRGLAIFTWGWIRQQPLSSDHFTTALLGCSHINVSRRRFTSGAPWEESVEIETDHSLARRVEQAITEYRIRKAAPDWLPFLPGSSYWLPPQDYLIGKAADIPLLRLDLTEEQLMAILAPTEKLSSSASEKDSPSEKQKNKIKKKS
ncbi:hypothetical protein O6H91_20G015200 [Diphasiastrum complanatum]|uniref:Uncharacterized protein n=2 Tax=Diphasiastrum complanatum TaxID=34168 RepID=A0ACC2AN23_DIPCM|nr:hypothetical protein O6H91_20G013900 [Diphasiastrum complanatum]KAJ7518924.1 hypothetical protein O6H91_20G015200 [Diphasiastrum complanatum]